MRRIAGRGVSFEMFLNFKIIQSSRIMFLHGDVKDGSFAFRQVFRLASVI